MPANGDTRFVTHIWFLIPTHRKRRGCRSMHFPRSWTAAQRQSTAKVGLARFSGHVGHVAHWSSRYRMNERVRDRHPDWGLYRERVSLPPGIIPSRFPPRADASATRTSRASANSWTTPTVCSVLIPLTYLLSIGDD